MGVRLGSRLGGLLVSYRKRGCLLVRRKLCVVAPQGRGAVLGLTFSNGHVKCTVYTASVEGGIFEQQCADCRL